MKKNLGDTSNIERVSIVSSADGSPVTGLTFASSGLIISTIASNEATPTVYTEAGSTIETIATLGTYAAPTATKCRFKEIDATNHPGDYELQFADARYAVASSKELLVTWSGVADMLKMDLRIQLNTDKVNTVEIGGSSAAAGRLELLALYGDYEGRMIWYDSINGAAGAVDNVNGTKGNPVSSFANAITLAASLSINHYHALPGSTMTLTQDFADTIFTGESWAFVVGGYDLSNAYVYNTFVFGSSSTSDTNNVNFTGCYLLGHTAGSAVLIDCFIGNDFTISEAANYVFNNCREAIGTAQAAIDFDSAGGAEVQLDNFAGTIELKNMATGDVINIYGNGGVIINTNCADGTINRIGGNFFITDNASGRVTITNEVARFGTDQQVTADVVQWNGTNVASPTVAGVPEVDLTHVAGDDQKAFALYKSISNGFLTLPYDYARLQVVSGSLDGTLGLAMSSSDSIFDDDWANDIGSLNNAGTWADGTEQGDAGQDGTWPVISVSGGSVQESIVVVSFEVSADGNTWEELFRWNLQGLSTSTESYIRVDGALVHAGFSSSSEGSAPPIPAIASSGVRLGQDLKTLSSSDPQTDLKLGIAIGDNYPSTQVQLATIGGGVTLGQAAESKVLTDGAATNDFDATAVHDGTLYTVTDDDNSDPGIDTYLQYDIADNQAISHLHMHGWFQDGSAPFTNTCLLQAYNWDGGWETIETLSHATAEQEHEPQLLARHKSTTSNGPGGDAGVVRIRYVMAAQDGGAGSTINLDHVTVQYVNPAITAADVWAYILSELAVGGDPGATPTAAEALMLEYMKSRNRHDGSTTEEKIYNDAGAEILERDLTDDLVTASASKVRNPN